MPHFLLYKKGHKVFLNKNIPVKVIRSSSNTSNDLSIHTSTFMDSVLLIRQGVLYENSTFGGTAFRVKTKTLEGVCKKTTCKITDTLICVAIHMYEYACMQLLFV